MNPFELKIGRPITFGDLKDFHDKDWMSILTFICFFIADDGVFRFKGQLNIMEKNLDDPVSVWREWIYRMWDLQTGKPFIKASAYRSKFNTMVRKVCEYLKQHPSQVSSEMKELMERHPTIFGSVSEYYSEKKDLNGNSVVRKDENINIGGKTSSTLLPSVQTKILNNLVKVADIVEMLVDGMEPDDIKRMETKDRISGIAKLMPILVSLGKKGITNKYHTQINLNGSTKEIEEKMLNYIKTKAQD
jgi:hypothetical protein